MHIFNIMHNCFIQKVIAKYLHRYNSSIWEPWIIIYVKNHKEGSLTHYFSPNVCNDFSELGNCYMVSNPSYEREFIN